MIENLNHILEFLWETLDSVVVLYMTGGILSYAFGVFIMRKVAHLFDYIKR